MAQTFGVELRITETGLAVFDTAGNKVHEFANQTESATTKSVFLGEALEKLAEKSIEKLGEAYEWGKKKVEGWIEAANEDNAATLQLTRALAAHGLTAETTIERYEGMARAAAKYAAVQNDQVI